MPKFLLAVRDVDFRTVKSELDCAGAKILSPTEGTVFDQLPTPEDCDEGRSLMTVDIAKGQEFVLEKLHKVVSVRGRTSF